MANSKQTGNKTATLASNTLRSSGASGLQKSLAGSTLAQSGTGKQTGREMETKASTALKSSTSPTTKTLAASVVAQSNKKR